MNNKLYFLAQMFGLFFFSLTFVNSCAVDKSTATQTEHFVLSPSKLPDAEVILTKTIIEPELESTIDAAIIEPELESTVDAAIIKSSPFLDNISEQDIQMISEEARRATLPIWDNIDNRAKITRMRVLKTLQDSSAPEELLFVPVAESGYNPYALSPTGAMGLWQLMPRTAEALGATHHNGLDGRRSINQSTQLAAKFLLKLHDRFDSWPLAISAYNLGAWGVQRRLNKSPWEPHMGLDTLPFPEETKHYVKQILGMIVLYESGEIQFSSPTETVPYDIEPPIDLVQLEHVSGLEKNNLFLLNPKLDYRSYHQHKLTLHLPQKSVDAIEEALKNDPDTFKPKLIQVKVQQGDSLWKISHTHKVNMRYLQKLNPHLKTTLSIGTLVVVPASPNYTATSIEPNPLLTKGRRIHYKVKSGDSLWTIAEKFGTSTSAIARINRIPSKHILRPGDKLWIVASIQAR